MTDHNRLQLTGGLTLAAVPTAARFARLFVRQRLSLWGLSRLICDAELVLSELVTNAMNATGTTNPRPCGDGHERPSRGLLPCQMA